jgi:hypothetical protein
MTIERNIGDKTGPDQSTPAKQDELRDDQLNAVTGGYTKQKPDGTAAGNVAAKWSVAQGAVA